MTKSALPCKSHRSFSPVTWLRVGSTIPLELHATDEIRNSAVVESLVGARRFERRTSCAQGSRLATGLRGGRGHRIFRYSGHPNGFHQRFCRFGDLLRVALAQGHCVDKIRSDTECE
jgi:hypothetical protein